MNIYPIIVIYNEKCCNSPSCMGLLQFDMKPLIVDNSTNSEIKTINKLFCNENGLSYINMEGNKGLSKAYNAAIELLYDKIKFTDHDYILWLDDDTEIDTNIINVLDSLEETADIYVPIVKSIAGNRIISPCTIDTKKKYRFKPIDEPLNEQIVAAINSGLLVKASMYQNHRYDEKLFLDSVDFDFFLSIKGEYKIKAVKDYVLYQNYSGDTKGTLKNDLRRKNILSCDYRYFAKKWGIPKLISEKVILNGYIELALRHLGFNFRMYKLT